MKKCCKFILFNIKIMYGLIIYGIECMSEACFLFLFNKINYKFIIYF